MLSREVKFMDEDRKILFDKERGQLDLSKKLIYSGLFYDGDNTAFDEFDKAYIDLDSVVSRVLDYDLPTFKTLSNELVHFIMDVLKDFFIMHGDTMQIYVVYSFDKSKIFTSVYPDWNKKRYERYKNARIMQFLNTALIPRLAKLGNTVKNIEIIKAKDSPVVSILKLLRMNASDANPVVITRDPHYSCLIAHIPNLSIYNGKNVLNAITLKDEKGYPNIHVALLPQYFLLCGMKRNEYAGIKKIGPKTAEKIINEDKLGVINYTNDTIAEVAKYKNLFTFEEV